MSEVIGALVEREYAFGFHSDLDTDMAPKGLNEAVVRRRANRTGCSTGGSARSDTS
jgi:hypothetical protein